MNHVEFFNFTILNVASFAVIELFLFIEEDIFSDVHSFNPGKCNHILLTNAALFLLQCIIRFLWAPY